MNPFKLSKKAIKEAVSNGDYELTGILKTGEVTMAILTPIEKDVLEKINISRGTDAVKTINKFNKRVGNSTNEVIEVYKQFVANHCSENICRKNGLRIRSK